MVFAIFEILNRNEVRIEKIDGVVPRVWRKLRTAASINELQKEMGYGTWKKILNLLSN